MRRMIARKGYYALDILVVIANFGEGEELLFREPTNFERAEYEKEKIPFATLIERATKNVRKIFFRSYNSSCFDGCSLKKKKNVQIERLKRVSFSYDDVRHERRR